MSCGVAVMRVELSDKRVDSTGILDAFCSSILGFYFWSYSINKVLPEPVSPVISIL